MAKNSVLFVTYHFPPSAASGSFRLLGFARHLPKYGWRALVVAPPRMPWEPVDPELCLQVPPETVVESVPYPESRLSYPARYYAPVACWLPGAWAGCRRLIRRHLPQVILTSGPSHYVHVLGLWLKRRYGLPWVADFRDPWISANPAPPTYHRMRGWWETRQERAVMAGADVIVANAPNARDALARAFPTARDKIVAIANGYDPERFQGLEWAPPGASGRPITILHPGQLYFGRDPRPFLDALKDVIAHREAGARPIRFDLVGNLEGDSRSFNLAAEVGARDLAAAVSIGGQIPYSECLARMVKTDILLLLDTPGRRIGVPAKLYEYVGAGRPVLALGEPDGDTARVLEQTGTPYRIARLGDREAIGRALIELVDEVEHCRPEKAGTAERLASTREQLTKQLVAVLERCTGRGGLPDSSEDRARGDHETAAAGAIAAEGRSAH